MKKNFKFLAIILLIVITMTGCGKETTNNSGEKYGKINVDSIKSVKTETFYSYNKNNLIVKLTNTSNEDIKSLYVEANYSEEDKEANDATIVTNLKANGETYVSLSLPYNENFEGVIPEKVDLLVTDNNEVINSLEDSTEFVDYVVAELKNNDDNTIDVTIANLSDTQLSSADATVIFFKDGKPIASNYVFALDLLDRYTETIELPLKDESEEAEVIDYDDVKVYVTNITATENIVE